MEPSACHITEDRGIRNFTQSLRMDLPRFDASSLGRGLTDPRDHHYDERQSTAAQSIYHHSSPTLNPIGGVQATLSQDFAQERPVMRARPRSDDWNRSLSYSEQGVTSWIQPPPDVPTSLQPSKYPEIGPQAYRHSMDLHELDQLSSSISYEAAQSHMQSYADSGVPNYWATYSIPSLNSSPSDVPSSRAIPSSFKLINARSRARNTPRNLQHEYLDTILRSKFPQERMTALNVAIRYRDEHPSTEPIPNELLDQLLDGPEDDKYYCFCCPKARKARTITPARDHVRKSLGNFPFPCSNHWCRHTSLRQADLNKHMKTCAPPPHY